MNVELQYSLEFPAMIYMPEDIPWSIMTNRFEISLQMVTGTNNKKQINVAAERIKAFVMGELAHCIFVNQNFSEQAEMFAALGANVTTLPDDPVDQIIGIMLYCKLNAIMEGRMKITQLDISSELGDSVWYKHNEEYPLGPFATNGWWFKSSPKHDNFVDPDAQDNVVHVGRDSWLDYDLGWADDNQSFNKSVVYADFSRNENK
jgi:hypothetical protein